MPASAFTPDVVVEIGFGSGYSTPLASISWTDVSAYVEAEQQIAISRGRQDEFADVSPSQLTLTLDNRDGRFTPQNASGAYYPNVKLGTPIRVSATWSAVTYRRFTGYVSEWPVQWPQATSGSSHVTVTATSRMARLGRRVLLNVISEEIMADNPAAYYPLGEPAGSTTAASIADTPQPSAKTVEAGGTVTFGNATGPGTDDLTAAEFAQTVSTGGAYLEADPPSAIVTNSDSHLALECFFNAQPGASGGLIGLGTTAGYVGMRVNSGALEGMTGTNPSTASIRVSGGVVDDGQTHHAVLKWDYSGGNGTPTLLLDGAVVDTGTPDATAYFDTWGAGKIRVGQAFFTQFFDGVIAHAAVYGTGTNVSTARFAQHALAGSTGFEDESTDDRVARIAGWADVAETALEAGSSERMSYAAVGGQSAAQALLDVARTENGIVFDAGDGTLTMQSRAHRYNATSALTLSAATQQIEADLTPKMDDQGQANDVTATLPSGYSSRALDAASIAANGTYADTVSVLTISEPEADAAAQYRVAYYATPLVRLPACSVQLTTQDSTTVANVLGIELGDLVTLTGLPTQAPASSMDFFVEGYTEVIGSEGQGWLWTANLSPGDIPGDAWTLGTSQLGTTTVLGY